MKKQYMIPALEVTDLELSGMLATSLPIDTSVTIDDSDEILSRELLLGDD